MYSFQTNAFDLNIKIYIKYLYAAFIYCKTYRFFVKRNIKKTTNIASFRVFLEYNIPIKTTFKFKLTKHHRHLHLCILTQAELY